jgi:hypothetical protein
MFLLKPLERVVFSLSELEFENFQNEVRMTYCLFGILPTEKKNGGKIIFSLIINH